MNSRLTFRRVNWKWSLPGLVLVAVLAAFFNPPEPGVTSGEFEYVQRVVDGDTLVLGTGERIRLIGVNTPETVHPQKAVEAFGKEASAFTKRMVEGKLVRLEFDPVESAQRREGPLLAHFGLCVPARRHAPKRGDHPPRLWLRGEQYTPSQVSRRVSAAGG